MADTKARAHTLKYYTLSTEEAKTQAATSHKGSLVSFKGLQSLRWNILHFLKVKCMCVCTAAIKEN